MMEAEDQEHYSKFEPFMVHLFFKVLICDDYHQRLVIPRKFAIKFREILSEYVILRGSSGKSYKVKLSHTQDETFFEHGWQEFARDHSLEKLDFLVFRYCKWDSCFNVMMFDRSGCEKKAAVQRNVTRSQNLMSNEDIPRVHFFCKIMLRGFHQRLAIPRKVGVELHESVLLEGPHGSWNLRLRKTEDDIYFERGWSKFAREHSLEEFDFLIFRYDERFSCVQVLIFDKTACEKDRVYCVPNKNNSSTKKHKKDDNTKGTYHLNEQLPEQIKSKGAGTSNCYVNKSLTYPQYFQSHRRPVIFEEVARALQSARAVRSHKPKFIRVMRPSHVYKRFFLSLPKKLIGKLFPRVPEIAFLHVPANARTWTVTVVHGPATNNSGLSGGWSKFVIDNNLEEGDACLFELCIEEKQICALNIDVSIFRVVDKIVPLRKVRSNLP
ncbi:B3 domain-containing protein rem16 [Thalictrum thalictroides]|uniref:B3 domain-containing protein rem16 n=1 Tax=Thalictrum thalictroides TaxID=46969 RepID=A0A7J6W2N5_THATH|nr:B3 domain-containing protein rem16 [Thalictrum thalictroides]